MTLPAGVTDEMVEAAARAINPGAYHRWDDDGEYSTGDIARTYARDEALKCLTAALAGRVVVPREPSAEMRAAGVEADDKRTSNETCAHIYRAMTAAAVDGGQDEAR